MCLWSEGKGSSDTTYRNISGTIREVKRVILYQLSHYLFPPPRNEGRFSVTVMYHLSMFNNDFENKGSHCCYWWCSKLYEAHLPQLRLPCWLPIRNFTMLKACLNYLLYMSSDSLCFHAETSQANLFSPYRPTFSSFGHRFITQGSYRPHCEAT